MATNVYFTNSTKERVLSNFNSTALVGVDTNSICIKSFTQNNGGNIQYNIVFDVTDSSYTSYIQATLTYNNDIGDYVITNSSKATNNKPTSCLNKSQIVGHFTHIGTSNLYDYYKLSDNVLYYPQIDSVFVIFFIIALVCFYFPYKIFARAFGRWFKV